MTTDPLGLPPTLTDADREALAVLLAIEPGDRETFDVSALDTDANLARLLTD